jgi:hypothetical protein
MKMKQLEKFKGTNGTHGKWNIVYALIRKLIEILNFKIGKHKARKLS